MELKAEVQENGTHHCNAYVGAAVLVYYSLSHPKICIVLPPGKVSFVTRIFSATVKVVV